jgi:hypothetical protein
MDVRTLFRVTLRIQRDENRAGAVLSANGNADRGTAVVLT